MEELFDFPNKEVYEDLNITMVHRRVKICVAL